MRALLAFTSVLLVLLAASFTYAHRALYQHSIETALANDARKALIAKPDFRQVAVSFEGLDAHLSGTVASQTLRSEAQSIVNALLGARAVSARNDIRVVNSVPLPPPQPVAPSGGPSASRPTETSGHPEDALKSLHVYFDSGSATVDPGELAKLDRIASFIRQGAAQRPFIVAGHADASGNPKANQKLSLKRAAAVAEQLIARGIPRAQLELKAFGDQGAVNTPSSPEEQRQGRRVEIWPR